MSTGTRVCTACGAQTTGPVCPSCGTSVVRVLPALLAGAVPAGTGERVAASSIDLGVAIVMVGVAVAVEPGPRAVLVAAAAVWLAGTWYSRGRTGLTPGHLAIGLRTVDAFTGLPVGLLDLPATPGSRAVVLDVRNGRDPTLTVAEEVREALAAVAPVPASMTSTAPPPQAPASTAPAFPTLPPVASDRRSFASAPPSNGPEPYPDPNLPTRAVPQVAPVAISTGLPPSAAAVLDPSAALVLVLDDGQRVILEGVMLLGRNPTPQPDEHVDRLVPLHDMSRTVSKTHARLRRDGATVWLADRGSTNGTMVIDRSGRTTQVTDVEVAVPIGAHVHLGDRSLVLRQEAGDATVLRPARRAVPWGRGS